MTRKSDTRIASLAMLSYEHISVQRLTVAFYDAINYSHRKLDRMAAFSKL
jgi:hypothetical protein